MKQIQAIAIGASKLVTDQTTPQEHNGYFYIDSDLYSGVVHIYFKAMAKVGNVVDTGKVELYDKDTSTVLATLTFTDDGFVYEKSADLVSSFPYKHTLCVRSYTTASPGIILTLDCALYIEQSDASAGKKTASYHLMNDYGQTTTQTTWSYDEVEIIKPHIENYDGVIKAYFEIFMIKTTGSGFMEAKIFDQDTQQDVAGSLVQTDSASLTRVRSGEITLIAGHSYTYMYRKDTVGASGKFYSFQLIVSTTSYTKCEAIIENINDIDSRVEEGTGLWPPVSEIPQSKIEANTKSFILVNDGTWGADGGDTGSLQYRNITKSVDILTKNDVPVEELWQSEDVIIPSDDDDEYELNISYNDFFYSYWPWKIIAILSDAFSPGLGALPNPNMPTGYHCFMSQFIKNCLLGYPPYLTPDCVNRCW